MRPSAGTLQKSGRTIQIRSIEVRLALLLMAIAATGCSTPDRSLSGEWRAALTSGHASLVSASRQEPAAGSTRFAVLHALVLHPEGWVANGGGVGGSREKSSAQYTWYPTTDVHVRVGHAPHELAIEVEQPGDLAWIDGRRYRLEAGNLFVISFDSDWTVSRVRQLDVRDPAATRYDDRERVLHLFQEALPDLEVLRGARIAR
jgi:hypothetical protein